jgi:hypothetical protein
LFQLLNKLQ